MTIPVFAKSLKNLLGILGKAEKFAKEKKFDTKRYLELRLAPDMFNFASQVEYACFMAVETAEKLSGKKQPKLTYDSKSFEALKINTKKSVAYLKSIKSESLLDAEKKLLPLFYDSKTFMKGNDYVRQLAVPNFHFHYVTAYDILRHNGVPIGKDDYLGKLSTVKKTI